MQLVLNIPMLADHARKDVSRPYQTGNIEAVVTRDGGLLVGHPNRFHGNHRLKSWPFLQRWQGLHGRHRPDSSPHAPSMGIVERIKEVVCIAPRQIVLDLLMKALVPFRVTQSSFGMFMPLFESRRPHGARSHGPESLTPLPELDGSSSAHGR